MPQNFLTCDRDQPLLLPPDLRDWLPAEHLAWFVIEAIEELDLEPFYGAYRADGHGAAPHEPKMMVGLLAYAYAVGERSSRGIERRCREDVAFRVICANQSPIMRRSPAFGSATRPRSPTSSARCSASAPTPESSRSPAARRFRGGGSRSVPTSAPRAHRGPTTPPEPLRARCRGRSPRSDRNQDQTRASHSLRAGAAGIDRHRLTLRQRAYHYLIGVSISADPGSLDAAP